MRGESRVWRKWSWGGYPGGNSPLTHPRGRAHLHHWPHHPVLPRYSVSGCTWVTHWAGTLGRKRGNWVILSMAGRRLSGAHCTDKETGQPPPCLSSDLSTEASLSALLTSAALSTTLKEDAPDSSSPHPPTWPLSIIPSRLASVSKAWELPNSVWVYCKRTQRPEHLLGANPGGP